MPDRLIPGHVRLELSTACQLRCPSCPTTQGKIHEGIGTGFLRLREFEQLVVHNPWIRRIEMSNWGEILLNPDLPAILELAFGRGIEMAATNGVNLNTASDEVLEALVRYRVASMKISIDGSTPESYARYRQRGDLAQVLAHVRKINELKERHGTDRPILKWQFVVFPHNMHEIPAARAMAKSLGMRFKTKRSWDDKDSPPEFHPAERGEGLPAGGPEARRRKRVMLCSQLWKSPQINWDGRILGCCVNHWGDFGHAYPPEGLRERLDGEPLRYARRMLLGREAAREDIPCSRCHHYRAMAASGEWLRVEEVKGER